MSGISVQTVWLLCCGIYVSWMGLLTELPQSSFLADVVTIVSLVIIVSLFSMQRFGTARVGFFFAPVFLLWFVCIALIGIYNIAQNDKGIFQAFSPLQIVYFFKRNKRAGWEHLGGVVLCITGKQHLIIQTFRHLYPL
jgi:KUP system potassium uptake protein